MTALLQFDAVSLVRGGRLLVENLNLSIAKGSALQISGPNGSGKSSLLRLAAGLLRAERGSVERAPLALADDYVALDRERTLAAALAFWAPERTRVGVALELFGIGDLADVPVRFLSSGQVKRSTLARVHASNVPLWLLDEPLNALDHDGAARLGSAIEAHRSAGGGVIAASHQPLPGEWQRLELGS